jgi:hypothetical protein
VRAKALPRRTTAVAVAKPAAAQRKTATTAGDGNDADGWEEF